MTSGADYQPDSEFPELRFKNRLHSDGRKAIDVFWHGFNAGFMYEKDVDGEWEVYLTKPRRHKTTVLTQAMAESAVFANVRYTLPEYV